MDDLCRKLNNMYEQNAFILKYILRKEKERGLTMVISNNKYPRVC